MTLEPFTATPACRKCGSSDINTSYQEQVDEPWRRNREYRECPLTEHLLQYCRNCKYWWITRTREQEPDS